MFKNKVLESKVLKCRSVVIVKGTRKNPVTDGSKRIHLSDRETNNTVVFICDKDTKIEDGKTYEVSITEINE